MSGQTVADLLGHYGSRVAALGLLAPAVYPRRAWDLAFDAGFTEVIRTLTPGATRPPWRSTPPSPVGRCWRCPPRTT